VQLDPLAVPAPVGDAAMWALGADEGGNFGTRTAETWLALALHPTAESADAVFDHGREATPFFAEAAETWSAVLQPFAHRGEINWLDPAEPGLVFDVGPELGDGEPFVVITSAGWRLDEHFSLDKALDFGRGVAEVRRSMAEAEGLYFQHAFGIDDHLGVDSPTVTMWRDDPAMRAFAYRPGTHKTEIDHYRAQVNADRTSFTRLRVLRSRGSVQGYEPVAAVAGR
jgi:hypothetical protein